MLRILVADHLAPARSAIKLHLSRYSDEWQVVAEAENESSLLAQVEKICPDIVLMHVGVVERPLSTLITEIKTNCTQLQVLVSSGDVELKTAIFNAGADGFMYLGDSPAKLITKLRIIQTEQL